MAVGASDGREAVLDMILTRCQLFGTETVSGPVGAVGSATDMLERLLKEDCIGLAVGGTDAASLVLSGECRHSLLANPQGPCFCAHPPPGIGIRGEPG